MASAGITPQTTPVRSGEAELTRITGAQAPSGVPVVITAPVVERPRRAASGGSSSRGRRGRGGAAGRTAQGGGTGQGRSGQARSAQGRSVQGGSAQGRPAGEAPRRRPRRQSTGDSAA